MTSLEEVVKEMFDKGEFGRGVCDIEGCDSDETERITLLPFNPIDDSKSRVKLCPEHQNWARRRNMLAEEIAEYLREFGNRIIDEKFLNDVDDGQHASLEEAFK